MGDPVSATRLYLGNLPRDVTKEDVTNFFTDGPGTISEIKLMNGFGFVEYEDAADARDVVPHFHGMDMKGQRVTVQFARGSRPRDYPMPDRTHPRPRRTAFRLSITGLPGDTSWQDLKDFARRSALDVVYSEVGRDRDGKGFVEFETAADLKTAADKLDNQDFKGSNVHCFPDIQDEIPGRNDRYRSRSPPPFRRGGYPPRGGYDDYRGPPPRRGYTPPREDYRRRSPPPRDYDYSRGYRSPPPRGPPRGPPSTSLTHLPAAATESQTLTAVRLPDEVVMTMDTVEPMDMIARLEGHHRLRGVMEAGTMSACLRDIGDSLLFPSFHFSTTAASPQFSGAVRSCKTDRLTNHPAQTGERK